MKINIFKLLISFLVFFLSTNCKNSKQYKVNNNKSNVEINCKIPKRVQEFLKKNSKQWDKVDLKDFNRELLHFLSDSIQSNNNQNCPYSIFGDFTNDGLEDYAIILKNNNYTVKGLEDYKFPFLVIFNDYKNKLEVNIIRKTGLYEADDIATVIDSNKENGILSYLKNEKICGINIIDIIYFEKSSFFVYWNENSKTYEFLNHLDTNLCERIKGEQIKSIKSNFLIGEWNVDCDSSITEFDINENNEVFISLYSDNAIYINCELKKSSINNRYDLFFKNVDSQQYYYDDKKNIKEEEISREKSIASIKIINNETIEMDWKGLYNLKTKKLDFVDNFILKKEYHNVNTIILKKCN